MIVAEGKPCSEVPTFPLGEVTATYAVLQKIPRLNLFAALHAHVRGQRFERGLFLQRKPEELDEIKTSHISDLGDVFFIHTSKVKARTLVWTSEDCGKILNGELLK